MADNVKKPTRQYFNFLFELKENTIEFYTRQKRRTIYIGDKVYEILSPVVNVFSFIFAMFTSAMCTLKHGFATVDSGINYVLHFEYKNFIISLSKRPKEYFILVKDKGYQMIYIPTKRKMARLKRKAKNQFLEIRIYFLGFCELCRRIFLLMSDFTPGGQWTVAAILTITLLFITLQLYYYSSFVFKLFDLMLSAFMFIISPVVWTLKDLLKVVWFVLDIGFSLVKYIVYILWLCMQGVFEFIFRVIAAISSGIYRSIAWFLNLRLVKWTWMLLLKILLICLELFVFKVIPVLGVVFGHLLNFTKTLSTYFYAYFVDVHDDGTTTSFSNTNLVAGFLTLMSVLIVYMYRKRFTIEVSLDDNLSTSPSKNIRQTLRGSKSSHNEVNFKINSSAHICLSFLNGECCEGHRCSNHHCPWPYHWQYRIPVQGWKSFNKDDIDVIEKLYCDPMNELARTNDVNPDLSAVTRRSHGRAANSQVKLDFQNMRMEVNYQRFEIRRLSTESSVKSDDDLSTTWLWYRLVDDGTWENYSTQKDIEVTYNNKESSFTYKVKAQEYRIYFFMNPMYERNMNPREYKRRFVRRRPRYLSLEHF